MTKSEIIQKKIFQTDSLEFSQRLAYWRYKGFSIVFTNGCFDLLHYGHVDYLTKASDLGDVLIVGLNTDASVQRIKGPSRPVSDEKSRAMLLASMQMVHAVVLFNEETPLDLIRLVQPDVLIKGADYTAENIVGYDIVQSKGGIIKTIDFVEGYSTSNIIDKIRKSS